MSTAIAAGALQQAPMRTDALDLFFDTFYRLHPVTGTFTGVHAHDHALPDFSPEAIQSSRGEMCLVRRQLAEAGYGVLHAEELSHRDWPAIDGALADDVLEVALAEDESRHFRRGKPSLAIGEALFSLIALAGSQETSSIDSRVEAAVSRLRAFPAFLHGARRTLGDGDMPEAWRDQAMRESDGGLVLLADLSGWAVGSGAPVSLCRDLQNAATHAAAAVEWYRSWLTGPSAQWVDYGPTRTTSHVTWRF